MVDTSLAPIRESLTIFLIGATGDLSKKKILKALFQLFRDQLLPPEFQIIGVARKDFSLEEFHDFVKKIVKPQDEEQWRRFCSNLFYVSGDVSQPETFAKIGSFHKSLKQCGNHLWYVATLPALYVDVVRNIKKRFANGIFENLWNHQYIDSIQVRARETLGVGGREAFYNETGAIRDVVQNHVLQMVAMTLMEQPQSLAATDIRKRRRELISSLKLLDPKHIEDIAAFGQYTTGNIGEEKVKGYLEEAGVPEGSRTETAVVIKCFVNTDRWHDVPIYLRAGKRLPETVTEISIQFKEPSNPMFRKAGVPQEANVLTLRIGPNEGVTMRFHVKKPGLRLELEEVPMRFNYQTEFQMDLVEAYVKLIYDAVVGDPTLFPSASTVNASWNFIQPLLDYTASPTFRPDLYPAGTWGPKSFEHVLHGHSGT